jgi:hypothetical protein
VDRFSVFQFQKSETAGGDVSMSGFKRLDRLSLPRRARRCANDAVITLRLVLQFERVSCLPQ